MYNNYMRIIFLLLCLLFSPGILQAQQTADIDSVIKKMQNRNGTYYVLIEEDDKWHPLAPNLEIGFCEGGKAGIRELIRMKSFIDKPARFTMGKDNIIYSIFFVCL